MKLTKTLIAAVAMATFALPMTATAQVGTNSVIGSADNVVGNVYIKRGGEYLRAVSGSAIMPFDTVVAEPGGSAMVSLNGCNGSFTPCNQFIDSGNMISLSSNNYCGDLASLLPIGPNDAVLSAAANVPPAAYTGPSIGTAFPTRTLLAILGAGAVGYGLYEIIDDGDDDDDEPTSP